MAVYQSNLGSIRTNVIQKLRLDATDDAALTNEWINQAYLDVLQQTGALQQIGSATLTSGDSSYTLPVTVSWIKHLVITYSDGSTSLPLQRIRMERILVMRNTTTAAGQRVEPPLYAVAGQNQIELWPSPSTGQSLTFYYVYMPQQLVLDADEPVIKEPFGSKLLEYGALVEGARFKKDPLISDYESQYLYWIGRFQTWLNRRMGASSQAFEVWDNPATGAADFTWERERTVG